MIYVSYRSHGYTQQCYVDTEPEAEKLARDLGKIPHITEIKIVKEKLESGQART
jgi:hypothetical protein